MTQQEPRMISNDELAVFVKLIRSTRKWTQEQLSEISGLNIRTIQRVESGKGASFDTRRALARAFDVEDIDCLNKQHIFPTIEELENSAKEFEKEHLNLDAYELEDGRKAGELAAWSNGDICTCDYDLPERAQHAYAEFLDYLRDFREAAEFHNEVDKLNVYSDLKKLIQIINLDGFVVKYAKRSTALRATSDDEGSVPINVIYVSIFPKQQAPTHFSVPRKLSCNF